MSFMEIDPGDAAATQFFVDCGVDLTDAIGGVLAEFRQAY